ncbi:hypothetical protein ACKVMT_13875 [Halobacteriales archaeon Cl-PHB]
MNISTYSRYSQAELELSDAEWRQLTTYLGTIQQALQDEQAETAQVREIEEGPPRISDDGTFRPGGWVGVYPGEVTVEPGLISSDEYASLISDIQGWIEIIGATTVESSLPLSAEFLTDERVRLSSYSRALIEISESILAHRLPVDVSLEKRVGHEPRGRPLFAETQQRRAQGSRQVVSSDVEFSFESLPNLLLVRFHAELGAEMAELANTYDYYRDAFGHQVDYHREFIDTGIPSTLLEKSIEVDFADPNVLSQVRREATDQMAEVVDLWEAYKRDLAFEVDLKERLNTAIKPMSKVYELWCLGLLLQTLEELTGAGPIQRSGIEPEYTFAGELSLHYNRRIPSQSRYLGPMFGAGSGEPDFAIEYDRDIVWIGDAKFKSFDSMGLHDYRRFLVYLLDFLSPAKSTSGGILHIGDEQSTRRHQVRDYEVTHVNIRPDNPDTLAEYLGSVLSGIL